MDIAKIFSEFKKFESGWLHIMLRCYNKAEKNLSPCSQFSESTWAEY